MAFSDETLMAYADGELAADEAAAVERAAAADPALARRIAVFAESRTALKLAYGAPRPVPPALAEAVRARGEADAARPGAPPVAVLDLAARRRTVPLWQLPAAAALALAVGAAAGWFAQPGGPVARGLSVAGPGDAALLEALGTVPSGARVALPGGAGFAAIATFRDGSGDLCREFEHDAPDGGTVVAVACSDAGGWDLRLAVAAPGVTSDGYAPASSLDTLEAYLAATEAGAPLSPEEEAAALAGLR